MTPDPDKLIQFWFSEPMTKHWFSSTAQIDDEIKSKFERLWIQAAAGKLEHWRQSAEGCLALCIVLDQLPLNMYRGLAKSFATEQQAIATARHALALHFDELISRDKVAFLIMPLMHSESLHDQDLAVSLFEKHKLEANLRFAQHHRAIIENFARFPHRNRILGRKSSQAELDYLNSEQAFKG
ncbi:MAG: DUF924 domain-containing protein [Gammaproteobacteria bacterium]|nr:DUF924 domain-containing protein [Gammaproteobacteria bacterium]